MSPDPPTRGPVTGFWDYGLWNDAEQCLNVVEVNAEGAGVITCATTCGDQLRHLACPLAGPCEATP